MHDAPQDVLTEAYPEEEYWQDLLKVTGGDHRRAPGADRDPGVLDLPGLDAAPRRALPAVAVGHAAPVAHQRLLHGRRQGAGQRLLPQRRGRGRADPLRREGGRARTARRPLPGRTDRRRAHRGARLRGRQRRFRVEPRVAARGLGPGRRRVGRRQLPDPRHPLQHGRAAARADRRGRRRDRRPDAVPRGGDRCARAALRRRHLHPGRLRVAGHRGQSPGRALLRRGRGLLAQALRDLGAAGRAASPGRSATRSSTRRRSAGSCRRCSPASGRTPWPSWRASWAWTSRPWSAPSRSSTRRAGSGTSTTRCSTTATPRASSPRRRTGHGRSTRRPSTATRSSRASPSPTWA